ncbi:unnamed protein product, partial [marine sediment metagenome]
TLGKRKIKLNLNREQLAALNKFKEIYNDTNNESK